MVIYKTKVTIDTFVHPHPVALKFFSFVDIHAAVLTRTAFDVFFEKRIGRSTKTTAMSQAKGAALL